ncbi:hypothetical protein [Paenibacillus antarcticus]|uniref:Uncharacterized protein n=1 Tax=Paenibacillus antarcticus TaxID=253703 RepID=A0A168PXD2_9BACL|nr:hypothetical protein [Paenibacillus antarcticus]OAB47162.1 hypothetical protein PBAT_07745 [Paenibacillus antarcticus]
MKKRWVVIFTFILAIFMLIGISRLINSESDIWLSIDKHEWENYESFAGTGMYFFEENNKKYCLFMIYGSGVPVAGHYKSEVKIKSNQEIEIEIPHQFMDIKNTDQELQRYIIQLNQGNLIMDQKVYIASKVPRNYKYIIP